MEAEQIILDEIHFFVVTFGTIEWKPSKLHLNYCEIHKRYMIDSNPKAQNIHTHTIYVCKYVFTIYSSKSSRENPISRVELSGIQTRTDQVKSRLSFKH